MSADTCLIVSLSARALAAAAARAGVASIGIDAFADLDARRLGRRWARVPLGPDYSFDRESLLRTADDLAPDARELVYGSGFEARPELLARLAEGRELLGNDPETVAACADPARFSVLLDELGIPHPETRLEPPPAAAGWLAKLAGGCGGSHILPATATGGRRYPGRYYQRRVAGRPGSLLFLADRRDVRPVGFNGALAAPAEAPSAWSYAGSVRLPDCPGGFGTAIVAAAADLTRTLGLRGLNGIDFIIGETGWWLLELNPRPTASLSLWDVSPLPPLFRLHREACRGHLPDSLPQPAGALASAVVYARRPARVPNRFSWPDACADLPNPGTVVAAGDPLCCVAAAGADAGAASAAAQSMRAALLDRFDTLATPVGVC
ncbi:ATP-grasp domain-containing protein [Parasulfuritortus cantonensis]|nr:ATP-grasp domain-containing protein [Parasulfuritortus cantonensis]